MQKKYNQKLLKLSVFLNSINLQKEGLKIFKISQDTFYDKWEKFLIEADDITSHDVKFLPYGMDDEDGDYKKFIKENINDFKMIEAATDGTPKYLGSGTRGVAFSLHGNRVIKFMKDPYEARSYALMKERVWQGGELATESPMIFSTGSLKWNGEIVSYWVIMEKLQTEYPRERESEIEKLILDIISLILSSMWWQSDASLIFSNQKPEIGSALSKKDLELNWNSLKKKVIKSISINGFEAIPFDPNKFKKLFSYCKECKEDFLELYSDENDFNDLCIWILESDLIEEKIKIYLQQIMLNAAHGYIDFQNQNIGWRGDKPIFFDPAYNFEERMLELTDYNQSYNSKNSGRSS